jgi:hypothetical protein
MVEVKSGLNEGDVVVLRASTKSESEEGKSQEGESEDKKSKDNKTPGKTPKADESAKANESKKG